MFKKKPTIPARPLAPDSEKIKEDIDKSDPSDPVFTMSSRWKKMNPETGEGDSARTSLTDPEKIYQEARRFVELNQDMQSMLGQLQTQSDQLQTDGQELRSVADAIRVEATRALR